MEFNGDDPRQKEFLEILGRMVAGEFNLRLPVSQQHDNLDTIALAVNSLVGELRVISEDAKASSHAKGLFIANISHEIRTPLSAIVGFSEILQGQGINPDKISDLLKRIQSNSEYLVSLIDELLEFSKVEFNRITLDSGPTDIKKLTQELVGNLLSQAKSKGVALLYETHGEVPESVEVDKQKFTQIFYNLLNNAIKFTDEGEIKAVLSHDNGNGFIHVDVIDTGKGIPLKNHKNIFEPFVQTEEGEKHKGHGIGLGLAISQKLAKNMGGDLRLVTSTLGKGTHMRLDIPHAEIQQEKEKPAAEPADSRKDNGGQLSGVRILLAEDTPDLQELIKILLRESGAEIDIVNNGQEAVEQALKKQYDIILMDIKMPIMDGFEATQRLREHNCGIPILAITAHALAQAKKESSSVGCDDLMGKPFSGEALIERILKLTTQA